MDRIILDAYLFFNGDCKPAMEFYKEVFGGELDLNMYDDMPGCPENMKGTVMHAKLSGGSARLMASDSPEEGARDKGRISLSLSGDAEEELRALFDALSEGGSVTYPLKLEAWGDTFGIVTDRYGFDWMVNITGKKAE